MEPSDEIRDLMLQIIDAYDQGGEAEWRRLWSSRPGVISLGTDPREWWDSADVITALHARQVVERGSARFAVDRIAGFQEGSVGWGIVSAEVNWGVGVTTTLRLTGIFHLEHTKWKLAHLHRSFGALNEDFGVHLTTNVESIAASVSSERTDLTHATAPNGTVTIVFTDIEGSTQLLEKLGESAWMDVLHDHNRVVREQVASYSGFEVKSQGDGFMLAFASARNALWCGVGIQRTLASRAEGVQVRLGLHTAEAIREADDFYGKGVVLAARVAAEARGGEILVSSLVRELVDSTGEFSFEDPVEVELKGLTGFHRLYAVRWREP
ncbi:MAG: nuclear transport factor 2 family protein [Actinobacteria bacterium]|nr:nuclear transport factor 2 family protein [Actinomycetota bacterium]